MGLKLIEGPCIIREYPADETHGSFLAGDLVEISAGELILSNDSTLAYGVALKDYGGSGSVIPVIILNTDQIWVAEADTTTTTAMEGVNYGLNKTAGALSVDLGDATDMEVCILNLDPRDGATTGSGGRVHIRFLNPAISSLHDA